MGNMIGRATLSLTAAAIPARQRDLIDVAPGGTSSNAYVDEYTASLILVRKRLNSDAWLTASFSDREAAILWATFLLDRYFDWFGAKASSAQALRWPRVGVVDADGYTVDHETIPEIIERSTAELAFELVRKDRVKESALSGLGIDRAKVGPIDVTIARAGGIRSVIPSYIVTSLSRHGDLNASSGGLRTLKLYRT